MLTDKQKRRVESLINTSVSDCMIDLRSTTDMDVLVALRERLTGMDGHFTRLVAVNRRIKVLIDL